MYVFSCRSNRLEVFCKTVFFKISQNSLENTCVRVSFLIKLQVQACNLIKKEALAQVFSYELCEISKNTFSYRSLQEAASFPANYSKLFRVPNRVHPIKHLMKGYTYFKSHLLLLKRQQFCLYFIQPSAQSPVRATEFKKHEFVSLLIFYVVLILSEAATKCVL